MFATPIVICTRHPLRNVTNKYIVAAFSTNGGDISFESKFISADGTATVVTDKARVASDTTALRGEFVAHREGTFVLSFDNSYSWFNSKYLTYHVELMQVIFFTRIFLCCCFPPLFININSSSLLSSYTFILNLCFFRVAYSYFCSLGTCRFGNLPACVAFG